MSRAVDQMMKVISHWIVRRHNNCVSRAQISKAKGAHLEFVVRVKYFMVTGSVSSAFALGQETIHQCGINRYVVRAMKVVSAYRADLITVTRWPNQALMTGCTHHLPPQCGGTCESIRYEGYWFRVNFKMLLSRELCCEKLPKQTHWT
ncbi:hypothetical protein RvY_14193 [Ramazzottius varieornatus]|uniref:Uncharacterized protein n=1 Tax=Ramazzottius varieornatus TaxID=947166 RepID=A0A1D1VQG3_RAMVA|nr:hypothetical protein RvY_14193 [Ramazzottius varieornatus]